MIIKDRITRANLGLVKTPKKQNREIPETLKTMGKPKFIDNKPPMMVAKTIDKL